MTREHELYYTNVKLSPNPSTSGNCMTGNKLLVGHEYLVCWLRCMCCDEWQPVQRMMHGIIYLRQTVHDISKNYMTESKQGKSITCKINNLFAHWCKWWVNISAKNNWRHYTLYVTLSVCHYIPSLLAIFWFLPLFPLFMNENGGLYFTITPSLFDVITLSVAMVCLL